MKHNTLVFSLIMILALALAACAPAAGAPATHNVLVPAAPDPAPPGVAKFSEEAFAQWKKENNAEVVYEAPPWPQLHDKMAANFASGQYVHDIMYNCGWVPEFPDYLVDFVDQLPADLVADLPASSFSTVTWNGKRLGVIFTLSLLTMFYNTEHLMDKLDVGPYWLSNVAFVQCLFEGSDRRLPAKVLVDEEGDARLACRLDHLPGCLVIGRHRFLANHRDFVPGCQVDLRSVGRDFGDDVDKIQLFLLQQLFRSP